MSFGFTPDASQLNPVTSVNLSGVAGAGSTTQAREGNRQRLEFIKSQLKPGESRIFDGYVAGAITDIPSFDGIQTEAYLTKSGDLFTSILRPDLDDEGFDSVAFGSEFGLSADGQVLTGIPDSPAASEMALKEVFTPGVEVSDRLRRSVQLNVLRREDALTPGVRGDYQTNFNEIIAEQQVVAQNRVDREFATTQARLRSAFGGSWIKPDKTVNLNKKAKKTTEEIFKDKNLRAAFSSGIKTKQQTGSLGAAELNNPTLLGS